MRFPSAILAPMRSLISPFVLIAFLSGCGGEKAAPSQPPAAASTAMPSPTEAKQIIETSPEWSDFQFTYASWSLPLKAASMTDAHRKTAQELRDGGWVSLDGEGNVVLTAKAKGNKRFLVRPNATLDIVPLAKKELTAVSAVTPKSDGNASANVEWRWIPNEIGSSIKSGLLRQQYDADHHAVATLMPVDGKWTVLLIEPK
jgi:hypothetical protein